MLASWLARFELTHALNESVPFALREMPRGYEPLTLAEFFTSKRAAQVGPEVHALWDALCKLERPKINAPYDLHDAIYRKELTNTEYEEHMTKRRAAADKGY
jgi:hypothetical protein